MCISQNTSVDGSEAILTRITYLHMTLEHHSADLKPLADRLKAMEVEDLAGYLRAVLNREKEWLQHYFEAFRTYEQRFQALGGVTHSRIVLCHAQVIAAAKATQALFPGWTDRKLEELARHMESRALERQQRCSAEHPTAAQFWQIYHYLNEQVVTITDADGTREDPRNAEPQHRSRRDCHQPQPLPADVQTGRAGSDPQRAAAARPAPEPHAPLYRK